MSGRVPPSSRANARAHALMKHHSSDVRHTARLIEQFKGTDAEIVDTVDMPPLPKVAGRIGTVDFIGYTTEREGRVEKYIHRFRASDRPELLTTPDGRQLLLFGGRFVFTARGIVDLSDTKNLPARFKRGR